MSAGTAASNFVLQLLQSAPHSRALSLAKQGLASNTLAALVPLLLQFPSLTELDLGENALATPLPQGFERLLTKLQRLDLSKNPGLSASGVAELVALVESRTTTPSLHHLSVTPVSVEDERKALMMLPHLHTINGVDAAERLRQLNQGVAAETAAGANTAAKVSSPASTVPPSSLAPPSSSAAPLPPVAASFDELPPLPPVSSGMAPPEINLEGSDLEPVALLFDALRNLIPSELLNADERTSNNASKEERALIKAARLSTFEAHINSTVSTLNGTLQSPPYSLLPPLRQGAILAAKQTLYDVVADAMESLLSVPSTRGSAGLASLLRQLREREGGVRAQQEELVAFMAHELQAAQDDRRRMHQDALQRQSRFEEIHARLLREKAELIDAQQVALLRAATRENKSAHRLETEREAAAREAQLLLERIQTLEQELAAATGTTVETVQAGAKSVSEREQALQRQMEEREKYWMEREAAWERRLQAAQQQPESQQGHSLPPVQPPQPRHQSRQSQDLRITASGSDSENGSEQRLAAPSSDAQSHTATGGPRAGATQTQSDIGAALARLNAPPSSVPLGPMVSGSAGVSGRAMTLRQVKDLIAEIYLSFDLLQRAWASQANLRHSAEGPGVSESKKETLLQHLYSFFERRFGLRSLIADAAQSLLRSLSLYAHEHSVAVFSAILRHTLDYDFRHAESRTKRAVREILRAHLAQRHPLKRDSDLQRLVEEKVSASGTLRESEFSAIVSYLFPSPGDRAPILQTIRQLVLRAREAELRLAKERAVTEASRAQADALWRQRASFLQSQPLVIPYQTFVSVLLDFQLAVQRQFLAPFVLLFRALDTIHSGLLSPAQFARLCLSLNPRLSDEDIALRLQRADPFGHQLVSFSDAVTALRDEIAQLARREHRARKGLPPEEEEEVNGMEQPQQRQLEQGDADEGAEDSEQQPSYGSSSDLVPSGSTAARHHSESEDEQQLRQHMQHQHQLADAEAQGSDSAAEEAAAADEYDVPPAPMRQPFHVHGQ